VAGHPQIAYQPGHPHGFLTAIYLAEIALCRVLWDPTGALAHLEGLDQFVAETAQLLPAVGHTA